MTSVGNQDTTGPMTRTNWKDGLPSGFSADLVMQSVLPHRGVSKPVDVKMHLRAAGLHQPAAGRASARGTASSTAGSTACSCPTPSAPAATATRVSPSASASRRFGLSPSAATGVMPLDMPESVLVRFQGQDAAGARCATWCTRSPVRDRAGLLTVEEGQEERLLRPHPRDRGPADSKVEQAFELSDASAERSAAGCTVRLNKGADQGVHPQQHHADEGMIANGYEDARTLRRRIGRMEAWLADPKLLKADADAEYAAVIEIDLADIHEPIVAVAPTTRTTPKTLSDVAGTKIDEVFIGSCMTNIGHFRAAAQLLEGARDIPVKLWVAPPTKMDAQQLIEEGHYGVLGTAGARMEMPGCPCAWATRRRCAKRDGLLHQHAQLPQPARQELNVYLGSAELAICSRLGAHPDPRRRVHMPGWACSPPAATKVYKVPQLRPDRRLQAVADTVAAA